jgi:hypothetical protein
MVECELLVTRVQQPQDILSTVRTNLRAWLQIQSIGAGDKRRVGGLMHAYGRLLTDIWLQGGKWSNDEQTVATIQLC